ncbi:ATP-binding protein [Nitrincola sp. MINF-07-Sa-05]|uniref:ATP-binding protein n=1 Tax=Nitrincola salilacus TaxID=3400273 RepID=UPI00391843EF
MTDHFRPTLFKKIFLIGGGCLLLSLCVVTWINVTTVKQAFLQNIHSDAALAALQFEEAIKTELEWGGDFEEAGREFTWGISRYLRVPAVSEILTEMAVISLSGEVLSHRNIDEIGKVLSDDELETIQDIHGPVTYRNQSSYDVYLPIIFDGRSQGYVMIGFSPKRVDHQIRQIIERTVMVAIGMLLLAGMLLAAGISHFVTRPLRSIVHNIEHITDSGDLSTQVSVNSHDEMNDLVQHFNQMLTKLSDKEQAIKEASVQLEAANLQLRSWSKSLEERVEERTAELTLTNQELEEALISLKLMQENLIQSEKLASLGGIVAGIAHEINTPIGSALTVSTALQDNTRHFRKQLEQGALKRSSLDQFISLVDEATGIMYRSLNAASEQVSHFKQVAVDQSSSRRRVFNLLEVVEEVISTLRPGIKRTQHQVHIQIPDDILVDSYPGPLGQVISNCFNNAVFHGFDQKEVGTIVIAAELINEHALLLRITDDGHGMSSEQVKHAFDPFYTTRLGQGGSGLGLHLVYSIVTGVLGGHVSLSSNPDKGTTLTFELPSAAPLISSSGNVSGNIST